MSGRSAALGLVVVLAAAACEPTPSEAPVLTPTPEPTASTTTYQLNTTVWYEGLVLTFETATAVLDQRGGPVTVELKLQNPGSDPQTLDAPIQLLAGGTTYDTARETVIPEVPGTGSSFTTLTFNTFGLTSADDGVIQVGTSDRHQGIVPFMAGGVAPVILKPVNLTLKGTTSASDMRLAVSAGLLRWDLPDWNEELPATSAALTVTYTVTYTGSFSGGVPFTGDNVRLMLPNGQIVKPRADGRSQSVGVIMPGQTLRAQSSRFEIPSGVPGQYAFLLIENGKQGKIPFTVPG